MNSPQFPPCKTCGERHHPWELCETLEEESTHSSQMLGLVICLAGLLFIFGTAAIIALSRHFNP
jgi:hypothetical protein